MRTLVVTGTSFLLGVGRLAACTEHASPDVISPTTYTGPVSDADVESDEAGTTEDAGLSHCNDVSQASTLHDYTTTQAPPPTPGGGTIEDGVYAATAATGYTTL